MRVFILAAVLTAFAAPALAADPPLCLQASRHNDYNARPLSLHEVIARNAIGSDKRAYVVSTTCIHVDRGALVGLQSFGHCLDKGDDVAVSTIDGRRESCRVTGVRVSAEGYGAPYRQ
jgi:hypothetical protein